MIKVMHTRHDMIMVRSCHGHHEIEHDHEYMPKFNTGTKLRPNNYQITLFYNISMGGHRKNNKILTKH